LAQLERVEELIVRKRQQFAWYVEELSGLDGLSLNFEPPRAHNAYWMNTIVLSPNLGWNKEDLHKRLAQKGIATRPFFHPLSSIPAYRDSPQAKVAAQRNKVSYAISPFGLNLPSALSLTRDEVAYVCRELKAILAEEQSLRPTG
jgi:perosamine synthetase